MERGPLKAWRGRYRPPSRTLGDHRPGASRAFTAVLVAVGIGALGCTALAFRDSQASEDDDQRLGLIVTDARLVADEGDASGEGLTDPADAATLRIVQAADGRSALPSVRIDGPGRRLFAAATITLPRERGPLVLRQLSPADVPGANEEPAFVRWVSYVAVLTPAEARGRPLRRPLPWVRASGQGAAVPAGATVRLRTIFRVPLSAGRCVSHEQRPGEAGGRAQERLARAPAWLGRAKHDRGWQWLRLEGDDGLRRPVRSGPTKPVLFGAPRRCAGSPSLLSIDPDEQRAFDAPMTGLPVDQPESG